MGRLSLEDLQTYYHERHTRTHQFRMQALESLHSLILENQEQICRALFEDLRKPQYEALISEIVVTLEEIRFAQKNLKKWMRPKKVSSPWTLWPSRSRIYYEPLGVVLIMAPWNYPFHLALAPLIGAIAAGNCAVVKPSELTPKTSHLIASLISQYFPNNYIRVVEGGVAEATELLELKFDHIFFTGSSAVGKVVAMAAAKKLVPTTLELGGKSPVIVTENADLDLASRRIVWGKFLNAGQTCVAPDYVYVHESVHETLLEKLQSAVTDQLGENPKASKSFGRIVNRKNCERLVGLLDPKKVLRGGEFDLEDLYLAPTILDGVSWHDGIMQEEIFGPLLPILKYRNLEDAYREIQRRPKPLAAYLFSRNSKEQQVFSETLSFGGGCINDVVVHLGHLELPFGGVGQSGQGRYHGEFSFQTFSHMKSVMSRSGFLDLSVRYPPYDEKKLRLLRAIFRI